MIAASAIATLQPVGPQVAQQPPHQPGVVRLAEDFSSWRDISVHRGSARRQLLFQQLLPVQLGVEAAARDQLVVRAALDDAAAVEHDDLSASRTVEMRCETMIDVRSRITPRSRDRISSSV